MWVTIPGGRWLAWPSLQGQWPYWPHSTGRLEETASVEHLEYRISVRKTEQLFAFSLGILWLCENSKPKNKKWILSLKIHEVAIMLHFLRHLIKHLYILIFFFSFPFVFRPSKISFLAFLWTLETLWALFLSPSLVKWPYSQMLNFVKNSRGKKILFE